MPFKSRSILRTLLAGTALALVSVVGVGTAQATVFGGSATFTDLATNKALSVTATPNPKTFITSNLTAGGSDYMAGFMLLATTDTQTGNGFCWIFGCTGVTNTDKVALKFVWTQPSTATDTKFSGDVMETTFDINPRSDDANLEWANDSYSDKNGNYAEQLVTFSNGAQAYVDLYDAVVSGTTSARSAQFDVRITDRKDPVPEPMSLAMLGIGMVGLGYVRRRKIQSVPASS